MKNGPKIDAKSEHFLEKWFFEKHVFSLVLQCILKVEGRKSRSKINQKSMLEKVMQNGSKITKNDAKMEPKSLQNQPKWEQKAMQKSDRNFGSKKSRKIGPWSAPGSKRYLRPGGGRRVGAQNGSLNEEKNACGTTKATRHPTRLEAYGPANLN